MSDTLDFDLPKNRSAVIKVIGVGGGGSNAVNYMKLQGIRGVDFIVCNTDAQALAHSPVENKIQLGATLTEGLGAGANPEIGEKAALESYDTIQGMLESQTKMVFITAGMGGGTGTGAAPIIAKAARELGILTVGIVTAPFVFEGGLRQRQAESGVEKLKEHVDSLIVINNNKLREVYGNLGFKAGFNKADEVLATAAKGIAEVITHHYSINIDLRDARTVLHNSGTAIMGSAKANGPERAIQAVQAALDSPLLNDNHIQGARHVLLLIVSNTGPHEITFDEIGEINDYIQDQAGRQVDIIMGIGEDDQLDDAVQVTVIATGFSASNPVGTIAPAVPETVVYNLEDEKSSETPKEKTLTPNQTEEHPGQIDLFQAIEDQPLPNDLKSAPKPSASLHTPENEPAIEKPLLGSLVESPEAPIVHSLDEASDREDFEPATEMNMELSEMEMDASLKEVQGFIQTVETGSHAELPLTALPLADLPTQIDVEESHEPSHATGPDFTASVDPLDLFEEEDEGPGYEMPTFDLSPDLEWDVDAPNTGMHPHSETDDAIDSGTLGDSDLEIVSGFTLESSDNFDAFSHDAPEDEVLPSTELNHMSDVPELDLENTRTDVSAELHLESEPIAEEDLPTRRNVSTFSLEDLRALEEELMAPASSSHAEEKVEVEVKASTNDQVQETQMSVDPLNSATSEPHLEDLTSPKTAPAQNEAGPGDDFELRVVDPPQKGPVQLDPENDPISRDKLNRIAAERRAYLQNYNHTFQNHVQAMVMTEQEWETPSYARKGMDVTPTAHSKESNLGKTGVSGDQKDVEFRSHNSFLHDNVD